MATQVTLSNRWPIIIHSFTVYCSDANHNELQECINGDVIGAWGPEGTGIVMPHSLASRALGGRGEWPLPPGPQGQTPGPRHSPSTCWVGKHSLAPWNWGGGDPRGFRPRRKSTVHPHLQRQAGGLGAGSAPARGLVFSSSLWTLSPFQIL